RRSGVRHQRHPRAAGEPGRGRGADREADGRDRGREGLAMATDTVSILDGNEFVVSDRRGDMVATPLDNHGLFLDDTRFLSRWVLTINGLHPAVLSIDDMAYFRVQHFMALTTGTIYVDSRLS